MQDISLTTRAGAGQALTWQQMDANWTALQVAVNALIDAGFITSNQAQTLISSAAIISALGFTPYNASNPSGFQTATQVNSAIQSVVGAAPAALDTLQEIATQLQNDESAASALTTLVGTKAAKDLSNLVTLSANTVASLKSQLGISGSSGWIAESAAPTLASASTIAPITPILFVSGTTQINTITPSSSMSGGGGQIILIPTGAWVTSTSGNIAASIQAVIGQVLELTYDSAIGKWYPNAGFTSYIPQYTVSYLAVGGGGGGGGNGSGGTGGGGGGGGGVLTGSTSLIIGTTYPVVIGAGGTGGIQQNGTSGSNTTFAGLTAYGGGAGGSQNGAATGGNGASGGGANNGVGGTGTQGNGGGSGIYSGPNYGCGGGGGAATVGASGTTTAGGNGGNGISSSIMGAAAYYGGGGGGGTYSGCTAGIGGLGGGGNAGASSAGNNGGNGTANTGGGGGGSCKYSNGQNGGNGGSGVVILSIPTASYSGNITGSPIVTTSGSSTILQFTQTGSYTA